jgi:hypothetical protein
MKLFLITVGTLAITLALGMLWTKGQDEKDKSLKAIAVIAGIAFLVLAQILGSNVPAD